MNERTKERGCGNWQGLRGKGRLAVGLAFIIGGLLLLVAKTGWLELGALMDWWPLLIIGLGLFRVFDSDPDEVVGGIWLLAAGIYCGVGVWQPAGLSWATGWPIMVVALGLTLLIESRGERKSEAGVEARDAADPGDGHAR